LNSRFLSFLRLPAAGREAGIQNQIRGKTFWIPAFASMTKPELAHVHSVHILPYFASPEGEGFPPSPKGKLKIKLKNKKLGI
jgi:hypothetical protein